MKILARLHDSRSEPSGAIVELSKVELAIIAMGATYRDTDKLRPGATVEICDPYHLGQSVLSSASEAIKLPGILRAFADTLDTVKPKIDAIITPAQEPESEEGT